MSFDRRLGELLDYEDAGRPGIDPALVIRRARRRRNRRTVAAAAATLVIAVSAAVTADLTGPGDRRPAATAVAPTATDAATGTTSSSPAPSPSAAKAVELSPVQAVAPGERFTIYSDLEMWVTTTEKCISEQAPGFAPSIDCRDSDSDNLQGPPAARRDKRAALYSQSRWHMGEPTLCTGIYLGRTPPARIVAIDHGVQTLATIVTTPGMDGWAAYYVVLPNSVPEPPPATPLPLASRTGLEFAAYDADGRLLVTTSLAAR
ncbi:hypothetical protein GCM10010495_26820 [Kitasatospora herbaricolor]|uniref:hypothetical protein n=1 Tax=Kitasatospora herbaricolor TaxID=68217 RepID=UPI00174B6CD3|nr:hypothetical protein [Kitasatospora herbaricolor]MDQ0311120.1 hypothetical protein [Kitasatospora herbaricolor]GGV11882.1 hypothetical protein GCM10010495_26820 [Kitasatospora herbaricolor]